MGAFRAHGSPRPSQHHRRNPHVAQRGIMLSQPRVYLRLVNQSRQGSRCRSVAAICSPGPHHRRWQLKLPSADIPQHPPGAAPHFRDRHLRLLMPLAGKHEPPGGKAGSADPASPSPPAPTEPVPPRDITTMLLTDSAGAGLLQKGIAHRQGPTTDAVLDDHSLF